MGAMTRHRSRARRFDAPALLAAARDGGERGARRVQVGPLVQVCEFGRHRAGRAHRERVTGVAARGGCHARQAQARQCGSPRQSLHKIDQLRARDLRAPRHARVALGRREALRAEVM